MKVAACQIPIEVSYGGRAVALIREHVVRCEQLGVELLCCPEAVLGGLADYVERPGDVAMDARRGHLAHALAPLASDRVTTVIGFTELGVDGHLYNAAAVFARGTVVGVYRKLHPAIRRSVYRAGHETPVFTCGSLTFGILLCRDSLFDAPARAMVVSGARALLIPTNNGMPLAKGGPTLVAQAVASDVARAIRDEVTVVRADVAGRFGNLESHGSSAIVGPCGVVLCAAEPLVGDLIVADLDAPSVGWSSSNAFGCVDMRFPIA